MDLEFMVRRGGVGTVGENTAQTILRLALLLVYLVRMHLGLRGDLQDRLVAPQRFQRYLGLEIRRQTTPCSHIVFLRYTAEYTLINCPIFRDHFNIHLIDAGISQIALAYFWQLGETKLNKIVSNFSIEYTGRFKI